MEGGFVPTHGFLGWFDLAYLALGIAMVWLLCLHLKHRLPLVPSTWLGKAQLLYVVFLWEQMILILSTPSAIR